MKIVPVKGDTTFQHMKKGHGHFIKRILICSSTTLKLPVPRIFEKGVFDHKGLIIPHPEVQRKIVNAIVRPAVGCGQCVREPILIPLLCGKQIMVGMLYDVQPFAEKHLEMIDIIKVSFRMDIRCFDTVKNITADNGIRVGILSIFADSK